MPFCQYNQLLKKEATNPTAHALISKRKKSKVDSSDAIVPIKSYDVKRSPYNEVKRHKIYNKCNCY